jgi:ATP-dependent Clp protease ATP-binding subunit ClpC
MRKNITIDEDKIFNKFTRNSRRVVVSAYDLARRDTQNHYNEIAVKHLFVAILLDKKNIAARLLENLNIDLMQTADAIMGQVESAPKSANLIPSNEFKTALGEAFMEAAKLGHVYVGCEHILLAIMKLEDQEFIADLNNSGLTYNSIRQELMNFATYQPGVFKQEADKSANGEAIEQEQTATLDQFGMSMNELASNGKYLPVFGREEEIERVLNILGRQTKNNPILIGESGVGKTAIIEGLVQRVNQGNVPEVFKNLEIIQIDNNGIIAGAKIRGDVEERLLAIVDEVSKSPNKVLFIDEIHSIVGMSNNPAGTDVVSILKPYLTSGDLQVIGATTLDEYRKYFEEDGALARRFQPVPVEELDEEASKKILQFLRPTFEDFHHVKITDEALEQSVILSQRYVVDRFLPDKAIDLIDEAAAKKKIKTRTKSKKVEQLQGTIKDISSKKGEAVSAGDLELAGRLRIKELSLQESLKNRRKQSLKRSKNNKVEVEDIREVISRWTKIPVGSLSSADLSTISKIKKLLHEQIVGQEEAIDRVANALQRAKLGLADEKRPLGSFLFLGPTGVGKTETAKVIARELFGSESSLIQANMSEYMEQHAVSKIIGAPPGYVGYQDGNHLSEQVRRNPYSLVLFDEIEKAHPELLNILLQILEEGEVQDSKGHKVSFKNTVIIMTSNIGAEEIAEDSVLGFEVKFDQKKDNKKEEAYEAMRDQIMDELKNYLRPEFVNRLDEIIVYRGLNEKDAEKIAKLQVKKLIERLQNRHIALQVSSAIEKHIAEKGFSKEYGARNIRRKLQEMLENELAQFLLDEGLVTELEKRERKKLPPVLIKAGSSKGNVVFKKK